MLLGPFRFKTSSSASSHSHFMNLAAKVAVNFIDRFTDFLKVKFIVSECVCVCAFVQHYFRPILILKNI